MTFYDPTLYGRDEEEEFGDSGAYSESLEEDFEEEEEEEESGTPSPEIGEPESIAVPPPPAPKPKPAPPAPSGGGGGRKPAAKKKAAKKGSEEKICQATCEKESEKRQATPLIRVLASSTSDTVTKPRPIQGAVFFLCVNPDLLAGGR